MKKKIITTIKTEEEVQLTWNILKEEILDNYDSFDPRDSSEWKDFVEYCQDEGISEEELLLFKEGIIKYEELLREELFLDNLNSYLYEPLEKLIRYSCYTITEENIHNYVTNWFKENVY